MTAKERHREKIMKFLSDPENDYPPRQEYAALLGITVQTFYHHFSPGELQEIENEAYEIRKKNSTRQRAEVLKAIFSEAKTGNVSAAKEFLDRTEGKVTEKIEADVAGVLEILVNRKGIE
jgi:hypothetical protein